MARGRKSEEVFELRDGREVGYSLKERTTKEGRVWRVVFRHPTEDKYCELSTSCSSKADAYSEVEKIILKAYTAGSVDPRKVTWAEAITELKALRVRPKTLEAWLGAIKAFTDTIATKGPSAVTQAEAQQFVNLYFKTPYKRSEHKDATFYRRTPQTVHIHVTKLKGLFSKQFRKLGFVGSDNPFERLDLPQIPTMAIRVTSDETLTKFFKWLETRYPGWRLPALFFETKAVAGCRLLDLCSVRSHHLNTLDNTLTINPDDEKTNTERIVPLPADLVKELNKAKGKTYLFEAYTTEQTRHRRPHAKQVEHTFTPKLMKGAMAKLLYRFTLQTGVSLKSHDFRKRAITRFAQATGSVDGIREAFNVNPATARKHYVAAQALNGREALREMQAVLRPKKG
ncbi:MAG: hypothetical protein C0467_18605 [Planctomycetaceae bacterium]|nr:hypothetical protein [Planctomycetaceae bacterium]